jgi:hypothetical protein
MCRLDGTENKGRLGATRDPRRLDGDRPRPPPREPAALPIGGIAAKAVPVPMMNIINGGARETTTSTSRVQPGPAGRREVPSRTRCE